MENPKITTLILKFEVLNVKSLHEETLPCYQVQSTDDLLVTLDCFQFIGNFDVTSCGEIELAPSDNKIIFKGMFNEPQMRTKNFGSWLEAFEQHQKLQSVPSQITLLMAEFINNKRLRATIRPSGTPIQADVIITLLHCVQEQSPRLQINKSNQNQQNKLSFQRSNW